jgi:hypothetical protein
MMEILAWIACILAAAASILCAGIAIGYAIAQTNPTDEEPIALPPEQDAEAVARTLGSGLWI